MIKKIIKKEKFISITKVILAILFEIGEINFKAFFPHPYYHTFCRHKSINTLRASIYRLKKRGLINQISRATYLLNSKARIKALLANWEIKLDDYEIQKEKWDGNWRVLIFDIPEKAKRLRDDLRAIIAILGFKQLQKSVWISPYKIPKFISDSLREGLFKNWIRIMEVKNINYDLDLKKKFFQKS